MFACQECGRKFKTAAAAERASYNGCPKCGGTDIDLAPLAQSTRRTCSNTARATKPGCSVTPAYRVMTSQEWDAFVEDLPELVLEHSAAVYDDAATTSDD